MTPDIKFLINCSKTSAQTLEIEEIQQYIQSSSRQQLTDTIRLAHAHGVFPLVYQAIQANALDYVSEENLASIKQLYLNIVIQNMRMAAELTRILQLLDEHDINTRSFKGPALSQIAYGDITLRQYGDLDILVRKPDVAKTVELLKSDGYAPEISLTEKNRDTFFALVNVIGFEKIIRIEVHWELLSKNYAIEWDQETLWNNETAITINGKSVPMLSNSTHLLYLCTHGSKHLFERLEWICDIDRFIRMNPALDWTHLLVEAKKLGIERMLLLALYLCHQLLASPLPGSIKTKVIDNPTLAEIGNHIINLHYSAPHPNSKSYNTFRLLWRMRENFSDRLRFAYRGLFAPKFDDFKYVVLPRQLTFLYPLVRPIRLLSKYFILNSSISKLIKYKK